MKERNLLNFAGNIKHIYMFVHEKSTEKAQLNAMPKSFYLHFIKFPMGITVMRGLLLFLCVSIIVRIIKIFNQIV